MIPVYIKC